MAKHGNITKRVTFCEVPSRTFFEYDGRVYLKLRMNLAEDENHVWVMFPSEAEVGAVETVGQGATVWQVRDRVRSSAA